MAKIKKLSRRIIALIVCAVIIATIGLTYAGLQIAFNVAEKREVWTPDYEMLDEDEIVEILSKESLSDEDYEVLFRQTGLTKIGIDRALSHGTFGIYKIIEIQRGYFAQREIQHMLVSPLICTDFMTNRMACIYLEDGDVIVTSSTHLSGFRIGHSGLVIDGENDVTLEASAYGMSSDYSSVASFTDRINFMVFSPKVDKEVKKQVVAYAEENLVGIPYDVSIGIFGGKNSLSRTQCAHVVWYAYKQFGIDLDYNGGPIVTPKNMSRSPQMELVQIFGLDPEKPW